MKSTIKVAILLMSLLLPALFFGLGNRPVYKIQEVRIAETAREMLASGDWLVPRYNGELRLQKPPLPYWLTAASYRALGVSESTTRLPSVLFGLVSAALILFWAKRESGLKVAAYSVLVLVLTYLGLRYFRSGEADAVLLFFVSAASMLGYDLLHARGSAQRRALFGLALGLGFLSKGPAALAIPVLSLVAMGALEKRAGREWPSVRRFLSWPGVLVLLISAFGWYLLILWKYPEIAQQFFGKQVDETFVSGTHAQPLWWYLAHSLEFFAPWGVLLVPAGIMAYRQRSIEMPPLLRFAWVWLAVVFVLLTVTVNKQTQYALLFSPPVALIIGHYLVLARGSYERINRVLFGVFCLVALAGVVFVVRKSLDAPIAAAWLLYPVIPLFVQRLLRDSVLSVPVLFVAGVTVAAFLCGEAYLSKDPRKVAAQALMSEAAHYPILVQGEAKPGRGELSFYANRVVGPVGAQDLARLLDKEAEVWLVAEHPPVLENGSVELIRQEGDLRLFRLRRVPEIQMPGSPQATNQ